MTFDLSLYEIGALVIGVLTLVGGFGKTMLWFYEKRLNERFEAIETLRNEAFNHWTRAFDDLREISKKMADRAEHTEHELEALRLEIAGDYMRREDMIRLAVALERRIDGVAKRLDRYPIQPENHQPEVPAHES